MRKKEVVARRGAVAEGGDVEELPAARGRWMYKSMQRLFSCGCP